MRILNNIFFVATVLMLCGFAVAAAPGEEPKGNFLDPVKAKDHVVLKARKGLVGAKVEVFSEQGELVTAYLMTREKMIIDFGGMASGTYTIRVQSEGNGKLYYYRK